MVKKKDDLFSDCTELVIWNHFKKYNKIKYFFLFIMGFFTGISVISIIYMVI